MRRPNGLLGLALTMIAACGGGSSAAPEPESADEGKVEDDRKAMTPPPSSGGATGDFSGDCACDLIRRELALDEADEVLDFTGEEMIARIEGEYVVPMVWGDNCTDRPKGACPDALPSFAGSDTEVRITIGSSATAARVDECNRGGIEYCHHTNMWLALEGTLTSLDGLLDETFSVETGTDSLDHVSVGERSSPEDVTGSLSSEVNDFAGIEWSFAVSDEQVIFEVFVLTAASGFPQGRLVSRAPEGGEMPEGHSWGVALDLDEARQ
jgi:hypothetical protein